MFVELYRNDGKFVVCYNESAYLLHNIFDYKLVREGKKDKLGFPWTVLDNVIKKLTELKINYQIYYKKELESFKDFANVNNYEKYLEDGLLRLEIDKKIDLIQYKLKRMSLKDINGKLEEIMAIIK